MQIRRFAVSDFRKLERRVEISGLEDGLNAIVGDNEEGKSTLLKALQAAFFDRHKLTGLALDDMMPFGGAGLRPTVEVDFELDGTDYRLEKAFGRNSAAALEGGGQRLEGDAAEDRLRKLLGFSQPGRGPAKEEHRGLAGLLWVEQGCAFAPLEMNDDSQAMLREAIEGEVGQVLGGERGRTLLAAVAKRTEEYFTAKGQDRKALKEPRERVEALEKNCAALEAELRSYDDKVDRLEGLQERLARYERDRSLEKAKAALDEAEKAVRQLEAVGGKIKTVEARMAAAQSDAAVAKGERDCRGDLVAGVSTAIEAAQAAKAALDALEPEHLNAERTLKATEQQFFDANRRRNAADADWQQARRARQWAETAAEVRNEESRLADAETLNRELETTRSALAANAADEKAVAELRRLVSERLRLRAALDAAAAVLDFTPEADREVYRDGAPVDAGQSVNVTEKTTFRLDGFGALTVTPGGQDIPRLRADLAAVEQRLSAELARLGLNDLAAAETALRDRQTLTSRVGTLSGELKGVAQEGLDRLREAVRQKRETLTALVLKGTDAPEIDATRAAERASETARGETGLAAEAALGEREAAVARHSGVREKRIGAKAEFEQKAAEADRLQEALTTARQSAADETLAQRLRETGELLATRRAEYEATKAEYEALDAEAVELELERARDAHRGLDVAIGKDRASARDLTVELRTLGQRGLAEELDRLRGELEVARADLARTEADASAWKMLLETLREAETEAKEIFVGPVRERLAPYLRLVFPRTELRLSEDNLEIHSLVRDGVSEPFRSLSIGTREQVAVLIRLALARLLRDKGQPVALVLDDPLVNTDDPRFERMLLALRKAAESVQTVILTCHEVRYEALGAKTIRLADCRATG